MIDEYLRRRAQLPPECVATVSTMAPEQVRLLAAAIVEGDHVRVGTEDYPFNHAGDPVPTHELVTEVVQMAEALGRPVATPEQARQIVGLGTPGPAVRV